MSSLPVTLPGPLHQAVQALVAKYPQAHVEVIQDNWAYVRIPVVLDPAVFQPPHEREGWIRVPIQFPAGLPHGFITQEPLARIDGRALQGYAGNNDACGPVRTLGGIHYYSWTWNGQLGNGPTLRTPTDVLRVIEWVQRRARTS